MRLHAVGGEFSDLPVATGRIAHPDHAGGALVVVLGGVEQPAVGREDAVAEEVTPRLRREPDRRAAVKRHSDAEPAGPAGERDPLGAVGTKRDVVAAPGKLDCLLIAVESEERRLKIPPVVLARSGEALGLEAGRRARR